VVVINTVIMLASALLALATTQPYHPGDPIKGLVAPVVTAFTADGELDIARVSVQAAFLNASGVHWVFTAGTTGESVDLTVEERKRLAEEWIRVAPKYDMHVIVHVGTDSVVDAVDMAKHAAAHGADAIAAMPPTYLRPATVEALVQTVGRIAAVAPQTPFYYYHIPSLTGVAFPMNDFVALADAGVPTLRCAAASPHAACPAAAGTSMPCRVVARPLTRTDVHFGAP
jgi:N-acetylneuraminate lyase